MKILAILILFVPTVCFTQIPAGYYTAAQGLTGNNLKIALHNIIDNHTVISYNNLWTAFLKTDIKPNGKVWDMYSDVPSGVPPYEFTFGTHQCGNYNSEADCYNREHSWPKSWFNDLAGPESDLFHVVATDGYVNNRRDNYPYGNVTSPTWTSLNGGKLGPCTNLGYSQTVFEPIDAYKGDFARGYFYMSTRYYSEDAGWTTSGATNKATLLPWQVNVLLQWHHLDPVSAKEIARNDSVYYRYQHNRNPFIDNPQWADSIWHEDLTLFVNEITYTHSFSIYPNPALDEFKIISHVGSMTGSVQIKITSLTGELIEEETVDFSESTAIDCSKWACGVYFINVRTSNANSNFKFVKQ